MELTLEELKERLETQFDEVSILELLEINSHDLLAAFSDRVEDNYDKLLEEVNGTESIQD